MLTLIKREFIDRLAMYAIAAFFTGLMATQYIAPTAQMDPSRGNYNEVLRMFWVLIPTMCLGSLLLGALQVFGDKKWAAFLTSLNTTRAQVMTAKVAAGVIWILVILVPLAVGSLLFVPKFSNSFGQEQLIVNLYITAFMAAMVSYGLGLYTGLSVSKLIEVAVILYIFPILLLSILLKGFGIELWILMAAICAAYMVRVYYRFGRMAF